MLDGYPLIAEHGLIRRPADRCVHGLVAIFSADVFLGGAEMLNVAIRGGCT